MKSSAHYDETVACYRDLVGLPVIESFAGSYGEDGTIFGLPAAGTQLEVVRAHATVHRPDRFDQLVFYLADADAMMAATAPLRHHGLAQAPPRTRTGTQTVPWCTSTPTAAPSSTPHGSSAATRTQPTASCPAGIWTGGAGGWPPFAASKAALETISRALPPTWRKTASASTWSAPAWPTPKRGGPDAPDRHLDEVPAAVLRLLSPHAFKVTGATPDVTGGPVNAHEERATDYRPLQAHPSRRPVSTTFRQG
jgi:hypothetical protein